MAGRCLCRSCGGQQPSGRAGSPCRSTARACTRGTSSVSPQNCRTLRTRLLALLVLALLLLALLLLLWLRLRLLLLLRLRLLLPLPPRQLVQQLPLLAK